MKLIQIKTNNAAFKDDPGEISRILRKLAVTLENAPAEEIILLDANGNRVGSCWDIPTQEITFQITTEQYNIT